MKSMKISKWLLALVFVAMAVFCVFEADAPIGGLLMATPAIALVASKDEKGNLIIAEDAFIKAMDDAADRAVDKLKKDLNLDKTPNGPPGGIPALPATPEKLDPKQFNEPASESLSQRKKRLNQAVVEIKGGRLSVEDAPKEIKMNRFIKALWHNDFATVKALSEGVAADGGNLVPVEFGSDLEVAIEEYGIIRQDAHVIPMTTNEIDLRTVTTKPTISRKGELVASDESGTKFGKPVLTVDRYVGHQILSLELLEDNNVDLYGDLITLFAEQFAKAEDTEGLTGTYYPGVLKSVTPTLTTLAGTAFADVKYKELVQFKNSLSAGQLMRGGKFYMHRTILGLFEGMEDNQGRPIMTPAFGDRPNMLLGYPVKLSEVMPAEADSAANKEFIIFGNLKWVAFGNRKGITADLLSEATLNKSGGGTVNLASEGAKALMVHNRWGVEVKIPANLAVMKSKA